MNPLFWLGWTQKQLAEWSSRTVTISLVTLHTLRIAAEMLSEGKQPTTQDKAHWADLAKECEIVIAPHVAEIDALTHAEHARGCPLTAQVPDGGR